MTTTSFRLAALSVALGVAAVFSAVAADGGAAPAAAKPDPLAVARDHIAAKRWNEASSALKSVNDTGSADWNNLMGYAARKATPPDLAAAERYYDAALEIDPKHRGALEYSGELYLIKGDLIRAEQRLQALSKECPTPCEEQRDLERAVARFKADGRYRPAD